jgi:hypothetical protein
MSQIQQVGPKICVNIPIRGLKSGPKFWASPVNFAFSSQPPDHRVFTPEVPLPPAAGPAAPTTPGVPRHAAAAPGASPRLDISVSALCF